MFALHGRDERAVITFVKTLPVLVLSVCVSTSPSPTLSLSSLS